MKSFSGAVGMVAALANGETSHYEWPSSPCVRFKTTAPSMRGPDQIADRGGDGAPFYSDVLPAAMSKPSNAFMTTIARIVSDS